MIHRAVTSRIRGLLCILRGEPAFVCCCAGVRAFHRRCLGAKPTCCSISSRIGHQMDPFKRSILRRTCCFCRLTRFSPTIRLIAGRRGLLTCLGVAHRRSMLVLSIESQLNMAQLILKILDELLCIVVSGRDAGN